LYEINFDKTTGASIECIREFHETSNSYTTRKEKLTLDSSSVWAIPEFPTYAILLILAFTSLLIVLYGKKLHAAPTEKSAVALARNCRN
jgi:hypothetical protein